MLLEDYIKEMKWIYVNARWEVYYELALMPLLKECCTRHTKVVPIHATRKPGRKSSRKHFIEMYSYEDSKGKRCGVPDYVIVPEESTYENPQEAMVFIEFKAPIALVDKYMPLKIETHLEELTSQSKVCEYIIFTDGITWFFGKSKENELTWSPEAICLFSNKLDDLRKKIVEFINAASLNR